MDTPFRRSVSSRELLWLGVTTHPNAQSIAQQLTEAFG
jgi:hypothetical protein